MVHLWRSVTGWRGVSVSACDSLQHQSGAGEVQWVRVRTRFKHSELQNKTPTQQTHITSWRWRSTEFNHRRSTGSAASARNIKHDVTQTAFINRMNMSRNNNNNTHTHTHTHIHSHTHSLPEMLHCQVNTTCSQEVRKRLHRLKVDSSAVSSQRDRPVAQRVERRIWSLRTVCPPLCVRFRAAWTGSRVLLSASEERKACRETEQMSNQWSHFWRSAAQVEPFTRKVTCTEEKHQQRENKHFVLPHVYSNIYTFTQKRKTHLVCQNRNRKKRFC